MKTVREALDELKAALSRHESVAEFHRSEEKLQQLPELESSIRRMKQYQQDAVLFQKIQKYQAAKQANQQADEIEEHLSVMPVVQDYRDKMQDASDLLQYVTQQVEDKINEEIENG